MSPEETVVLFQAAIIDLQAHVSALQIVVAVLHEDSDSAAESRIDKLVEQAKGRLIETALGLLSQPDSSKIRAVLLAQGVIPSPQPEAPLGGSPS